MKIAPLTEHWNEGERDWSFVKNARAEIEAWENREQIQLPGDYRDFMLRFNGGYIYPRIFRLPSPSVATALTGDEHIVEPIYDWKTVESHWRGETFGQSLPPGYLAFAGTPGPLELLMALRAPQAGYVFAWVHTSPPWGSDNNKDIYRLASSFSGFLQLLRDDQEASDYKSWNLPIYSSLVKEFEI